MSSVTSDRIPNRSYGFPHRSPTADFVLILLIPNGNPREAPGAYLNDFCTRRPDTGPSAALTSEKGIIGFVHYATRCIMNANKQRESTDVTRTGAVDVTPIYTIRHGFNLRSVFALPPELNISRDE